MTQQKPDRMLTLQDFGDREGLMESMLIDHFAKRVCSHLFGWLDNVRIGDPVFMKGELWLDSGRIRLASLSANQTAAFLIFHKVYVNAQGRELAGFPEDRTYPDAFARIPEFRFPRELKTDCVFTPDHDQYRDVAWNYPPPIDKVEAAIKLQMMKDLSFIEFP